MLKINPNERPNFQQLMTAMPQFEQIKGYFNQKERNTKRPIN